MDLCAVACSSLEEVTGHKLIIPWGMLHRARIPWTWRWTESSHASITTSCTAHGWRTCRRSTRTCLRREWFPWLGRSALSPKKRPTSRMRVASPRGLKRRRAASRQRRGVVKAARAHLGSEQCEVVSLGPRPEGCPCASCQGQFFVRVALQLHVGVAIASSHAPVVLRIRRGCASK